MRQHLEPEEVRLAADLAKFLRSHPQGEFEDKAEVVVRFYYDDEPTGVWVRKDGCGTYRVSIGDADL